MALPQDIRFCTSVDGVRLATAATGNGPALVRAGTSLTHLGCDADHAETAAFIVEISRHHTFVRYDARGCGLSDRMVPPLEFGQLVDDLHAVVESRKLARFALLGVSMGAAVSIAYAVLHPERVTHLVLVNGFARSYYSASHVPAAARAEAELTLRNAEIGWGNAKSVFRHVYMAQMLGTTSVEQQDHLEERMRLSMTPDIAVAYLEASFAIDVKDACARVACPTLVFHTRGNEMVNFEQGRRLAAYIPGARFVPLESRAHCLLATDPAAAVFHAELRAFLGGSGSDAGARLTARQLQVLQAVAAGMGNKQIARHLGLSPRTVEMHVASALKALDCASRAEAVHRAGAAGLLDAGSGPARA